MATPAPLQEPPDFSLAVGGPVYRMLNRLRPAGRVLQLLRRQAAVSILICWVPLVVLSLAQGNFSGGIKLSFLRDIETHVRFLVSLPVLVLAEIVVHRRIRPIITRFVERNLITPEERPKYYASIDTAVAVHNSVITEIVILVVVFTGGLWFWRHQIAGDIASWYASSQGGQIHLTMAGYWLAFVSVPVFQFILLRWYMQIFVWSWFLFRVSRLELQLRPLHPDRAGAIGFVGLSSMAFAPLLFAQSALISGQIASHILYNGESLFSSEIAIFSYVFFSVMVALAPLLLFTPQLILAKRRGLARYGNFATEFVTNFDERWLMKAGGDPMLADQDLQSLADLGNSFAVVREMRFVPISPHDVLLLVLATIGPFLPLLLTIMPLDQLVVHALKIVF
jgi:hypothetical protein